MAVATAPVTAQTQRELALELVGLMRKNVDVFARIDDIKTALRKLATDAGENFKEEFPGKGAVKVSGGHDAEFKGILPEVNVKTFLALPPAKSKKLIDDGLINMTPKYGKPYYGSVTVDLF